MPEKDPNGYSLLAYTVFVVLALWGGVVTYVLNLRKSSGAFIIRDACIQAFISGFVGVLTSLLCWHLQAPIPMAGFLAGMSGYMGSKALTLFENRASKILGDTK